MGIDYSKSAVNLVNPVEVKEKLEYLNTLFLKQSTINEKIESAIPETLMGALTDCTEEIVIAQGEVRGLIEKYGSYQDLEIGCYAVKQRKVTKIYDVDNFEKGFPQAAPLVIKRYVDTDVLAGLVKGGVVKEVDLKNPDCPVITEKESFSYIIKAGR